MTNSVRKKCGMTDVETCPLCKQAPETELHVFRDYGQVKHVWLHFQKFTAGNVFYSNNNSDWLSKNLVYNDVAAGLGPWTVNSQPLWSLDCVWCNCNYVVFASGNHSIGGIIHQSKNMVRDF